MQAYPAQRGIQFRALPWYCGLTLWFLTLLTMEVRNNRTCITELEDWAESIRI